MKNAPPFLAAACAMVMAASAALGQANPVWVAPVRADAMTSPYFDPDYPRTERRQHLGVDLAAPSGTEVRAPASGQITLNATSNPDVAQAYLLLREDGSGAEHVLGHISSPLVEGVRVSRGQVVGTVRPWPDAPRRSHVHWGVNASAIKANAWPAGVGDWGWGRGPRTLTPAQAEQRGWVDLNPFIRMRETIEAQASTIDLIPHPSMTRRTRCGETTDVGMELGRTYSRVGEFNLERGWQPDGGCFFVFQGGEPITEADTPGIVHAWRGLSGVRGVQSYQIMYADPNQLAVWVWGPYDPEAVRQFLLSRRQPATLTLARVCCSSPPR